VRFELEGQGPSWWEGNIKGARITNDPPSYLVTFDDAEYTNTFSTQIIRKAAGVPRMTLKKAVLHIPQKVAVHADISKLDSAGRLFCLRLTKDSMGSDCVTVIGYPDDVDRLCEPDCLRFHLVQLEKMADYVRMPASHRNVARCDSWLALVTCFSQNIQVALVQQAHPKHREVITFEIPANLVGLSVKCLFPSC
jgi:hypothetical protein